MAKNRNLIILGISILSISAFGIAYSQNSKKIIQKIIPAPVNYWADISNGGNGFMPNLPFGIGKSQNNSFGDALHGSPGKHADIAIYHKDFPRNINATQTLPNGAKLKTINLIPTPVANNTTPPPSGKTYENPMEKGEMKDFTLKFYWGCGASVKAGQPKIFQIKNGQMTNAMGSIGSRGDNDRGAHTIDVASRWPNAQDKRDFGDANLIGAHSVKGTNIPQSLGFTLNNAQSFMSDLGLKTSGDKSGIITASWNNIAAKAYFLNGFGMSGNEGMSGNNSNSEMIIWSASELPDTGSGLIEYLSPSNLNKYLGDKVILPATQTSCQLPSGIFANSQMIMLRGIGYGEETNMVYPARPTDPSIPWVQEWTAKIRNKSLGMAMVGMPSIGDAMRGETAKPNETEAERKQRECEQAQQTGQNIGSSVGSNIGSALGGWKGAAVGNVLGGLGGKKAVKNKC